MSSSSYQVGRNTIVTLLEQQPDRVSKVFLSASNKPDKRLSQIRSLCKENRIPLMEVPHTKLDALLQSQDSSAELRHQGVVALVLSQPVLTLEELLASYPAKEPGLLLMLDGIEDAHNLGAILRVADASGCKGVILPERRSAPLSPTACKVACGAEQTVPIAVVHNLSQALSQLKDQGFWIAAAVCDDHAVRYDKQAYDMPTVLVMGSEGKGIRRGLLKSCDFYLKIPMLGEINSLNVSTATAVLTFEIARQQRRFT